MQNTGWILAGQGRSVDRGQDDWTNPGRVTADDDSLATDTATSGGDSTDWLVADTFAALGIPTTATIRGIEFKVQAKSDHTGGLFVGLNVGKADGTLGTAKTVAKDTTTSLADYIFGGPLDLWGLTWTVAEAEADGTQARFYFENDNFKSSATFSVDAVWIKVYYTRATEKVIFLTSTGAGLSWDIPADWNSQNNSVECLGGGGNATRFSSEPGGGGGGGAWSIKSNIALNPGTTAGYGVGDGTGGDTWFNGTALGSASVSAEGGTPNSGRLGGAGGQASNGIGDTKASGGTGGTNPGTGSDGGGGGGGAAGPHGAGASGGDGGAVDNDDAGGGGGGANGGTSGGTGGDSVSGGGGFNRQSFGNGSTNGGAGSSGGGGGGANVQSQTGGAASADLLWVQTSNSATAGAGSGAGGGSSYTGNGGTVASYGGGAGGTYTNMNGAQGIIIISYIPNASKTRTYIVG